MSVINLFRQRETGLIGHNQWRPRVLTMLSMYELPSNGGLVWVIGTKNKRAFLTNILETRPDHLMVSRSDLFSHPDMMTYFEIHPRGTVVLDDVVHSISWLHDDTLCDMIFDRPDGLTIVVCVDVPIHATEKVLDISDHIIILPTHRKHFGSLAYTRYFSDKISKMEFDRTWKGLKSGQVLMIKKNGIMSKKNNICRIG